MQVYLVGGAVRDKLLNYSYKDCDYVVVGSTAEEMLAKGYKQVGVDFPVFLHPETREEYALARTERKSGVGYKGFEVFAEPSVTLEQDLLRRDLTINAMAESVEGIIDPYGGQTDLKKKLLRHVSPAFKEDPLRVLRVARFAARFAHLGFQVADETLDMMRAMVSSGELNALVAERVWSEISRALAEQTPERFFQVLRDCGALAIIFPEVDRLFGVPQPELHHPEVDTGIHTFMVLQQAAALSTKPEVRFASLMHDLGKGLTPKEYWPKHHGHEEKGVGEIKKLCKRLAVPNVYADLAQKVAKYHTHCHRAFELKPSTLLKTIEALDAFRQPEKLDMFVLACKADSRGRTGFENNDYPQAEYVLNAFKAAKQVNVSKFVEQGMTGKQIKEALSEARMKAIEALKNELDV
jgi:tRNA nucleotidyltransferase (CCA-adding enzyme)